MKTIKTYESFLDIFKKKTNEDDNFIIEFINRLNKVKNNNPYNIEKIEQLPDWISYEYEKNPMYKVEFEDVNIIIKGIGYITKYDLPSLFEKQNSLTDDTSQVILSNMYEAKKIGDINNYNILKQELYNRL